MDRTPWVLGEVENSSLAAPYAEPSLTEKQMEKAERSLRFMVEKWLLMAPSVSVRVTRGSRVGSAQRRYVCVEALQSAYTFAIYLFRQCDGTWDVFPPDAERRSRPQPRRGLLCLTNQTDYCASTSETWTRGHVLGTTQPSQGTSSDRPTTLTPRS